jgi:hemerythrin-like metal-binding protein
MSPDQPFPSTGWKQIDEDHQRLAADIARLLQTIGAERIGDAHAAAADFLVHVGDHFAAEERLMAQAEYPPERRKAHAEAHAIYLADLEKQFGTIAKKGLTADLRRWAGGRLISWFRLHVSTHDVDLGLFLQGKLKV